MNYGYVRVSTKGQLDGNSVEDQKRLILGRYPDAVITVESMSGSAERPLLNELLDKSGPGDMIIVSKLDRFCRSTKEGLEYIDRLMNKDVRIHILNMGLIEDNAIGRLIVTNLLAFAEFERAMIRERVQAGKEIARTQNGYREGRPSKFTEEQIEWALSLLDTHSYSQVEKMTGISKSTIYRYKKVHQCQGGYKE